MNELRSETFIIPGYRWCLWVQTSRLNLLLYLHTVELLLGRIFLEVCQLYSIWAMSKLDNILHAAKCFFVNSKQAYIFKGGKTILRVRSCRNYPKAGLKGKLTTIHFENCWHGKEK